MRQTLKNRRKKPLHYLFVSILSFLLLVTLILTTPPDTQLSFLGIEFSILTLFFLLVILFFFSLPTFLFSSKKHGILLSGFVTLYLMFRLMDLTHPFFLIVLLALFLTLELLFTSRRNE